MHKRTTVFLLICGAVLIDPAALRAATYDPGAILEKAQSLITSAREAESRKDYASALEEYRRARKYLVFLRKKFPDYKPAEINARGRKCREKISRLEDEVYKMPSGYIRVWPGMRREGARYTKGRSLAPKVRKVGEDRYGVGKFTVKIVRVGERIGASCDGPDFQYRGLEGDYACKHIWAVVVKEDLLEKKRKKK